MPLSIAIQDAVLEPLDPGARQAEVTRRLQQAIALGFFRDGEQLPNGIDLAAKLGVSTVTLRFALAELRSFGLLITRRGRGGGNFVRLPPKWVETHANEHLNEISLDDLRDLRDYSVAISGGISRLAAERSRPAAIADLRTAAQAVAACTTSTELARADLLFHMEVAAATRSAKLTKAELEIQSSVALFSGCPMQNCRPPNSGAEHAVIVEAIAAWTLDAARLATERHISDGINRLIEARMESSDFLQFPPAK